MTKAGRIGLGGVSRFKSESTEGSFLSLVRAAFNSSVSVGRFAGSCPPEGLVLERLLGSTAPLALGSSGEGTLRTREDTGWRRGAMRKPCSWGSSRSCDGASSRDRTNAALVSMSRGLRYPGDDKNNPLMDHHSLSNATDGAWWQKSGTRAVRMFEEDGVDYGHYRFGNGSGASINPRL